MTEYGHAVAQVLSTRYSDSSITIHARNAMRALASRDIILVSIETERIQESGDRRRPARLIHLLLKFDNFKLKEFCQCDCLAL